MALTSLRSIRCGPDSNDLSSFSTLDATPVILYKPGRVMERFSISCVHFSTRTGTHSSVDSDSRSRFSMDARGGNGALGHIIAIFLTHFLWQISWHCLRTHKHVKVQMLVSQFGAFNNILPQIQSKCKKIKIKKNNKDKL